MRRPVSQTKPFRIKAAAPLATWLLAVMLVLVTLAVYWPATRCGFVNLDDGVNVAANVHVQQGLTWESIKWALFHPLNGGWLPLTVWSHMLVYQVCGSAPGGHHLVNVLLHALNVALVFALLQQMTGARWRSLLVAACFAVHPLRVEAVVWVTERREVLCVFFGLLSLMAYVGYAQRRMQNAECRMQKPEGSVQAAGLGSAFDVGCSMLDVRIPSSIFYLLSLFFLALGLMSKPTLVTWPFVMLLLDYWPLRRMPNAECRMPNAAASTPPHVSRFTFHASRFTFHVPRPLLFEKIPFFVLAALESVVTIVVQKHGGGLAAGESLPLSARLANALISCGRYLGKLLWPTDLAVYYPHPGHWPLGQVLLAGGLILGISLLVWAQRRRFPFLLMGWLWYCGTLVPLSQVIQTGGHAMADRWTYLPTLGMLILVVWGGCDLTRGWRYQVVAWSAAGGAAIFLCLALTRQQIGYWKDGETLFRHTLAVTQNNAVAHDALGVALNNQGQIDEAICQFQEAVRLNPAYANAHYNLGVAFFQRGRIDEAIRQFQEALRLVPDHPQAHNNLGAALGRQGQTDEAIRQFQEALRLQPDNAEARKNLNLLLANKAAASPPPGGALKP
jgi:protein O-mannosyl-transferase